MGQLSLPLGHSDHDGRSGTHRLGLVLAGEISRRAASESALCRAFLRTPRMHPGEVSSRLETDANVDVIDLRHQFNDELQPKTVPGRSGLRWSSLIAMHTRSRKSAT